MVITEYTDANGDYVVEIKCSAKKGDRAVMCERNKDRRDVPLAIVYNMGVDFTLRTGEEQKQRVMAMLKMMWAQNQEVVGEIGGMVGAKMPERVRPHELGLSGERGRREEGVNESDE